MARVCRPGGRIGLANWTPEGFIGQMFKISAATCRRRPACSRPSLWGTEAHLAALFGARAATIAVTPRTFNFRYRSAAHFIDVFRTWYGPVHKAFAALPPEKAAALEQRPRRPARRACNRRRRRHRWSCRASTSRSSSRCA